MQWKYTLYTLNIFLQCHKILRKLELYAATMRQNKGKDHQEKSSQWQPIIMKNKII